MIRFSLVCACTALLSACSALTPRSTPPTPFLPSATSLPRSTPTGTPVPPTITSTPSPTPEWSFSGPIAISEGASSAILHFAVSEDGSSITSVGVTLSNVECDGMLAESMSTASSGRFPITEGEFEVSASGLGELQGRFTSPTEASGVIDLRWEGSVLGQTLVCELGEWDWTATAQ